MGSEKMYYLMDGHGSVIRITNASGTVQENYYYDAFGNEQRPNANHTNPFRYCGEYFDKETGNLYLRARYYNSQNGRFTTEDPAFDGINWYVYCNNNPIYFGDSSGLAPTAKEAAAMAAHIYVSEKNDPYQDRVVKVDGKETSWRLIDVWEGRESLKMGIYVKTGNKNDWKNPKEYAIVFRGSIIELSEESLQVWINNVEQAVSSKSADMWDAINYAIGFVESHPGYETTFIGHSKGGAEAAAAAVATNKNAILFNPANVNLSDYGLSADNYTAAMTQYVVVGEILSVLGIGPISSRRVPNIETKWLWPKADILNVGGQIINHMMDAVIKGLG